MVIISEITNLAGQTEKNVLNAVLSPVIMSLIIIFMYIACNVVFVMNENTFLKLCREQSQITWLVIKQVNLRTISASNGQQCKLSRFHIATLTNNNLNFIHRDAF